VNDTVRLFKFFESKYALKTLNERKLKISQVLDLNDPFELQPFDVSDPATLQGLTATRNELARRYGVLCFSKSWKSPVLWAHYAEKHKGVCLGFDVPVQQAEPINYVDSRLVAGAANLGTVKELLYTKYRHWEYEDEVRMWAGLEDVSPDGLYFTDFGAVTLAEVILGCRCSTHDEEAIRAAVADTAPTVRVIRCMPAAHAFEMVESNVVLLGR
jgi:Protein of unknown function (DUF2971)